MELASSPPPHARVRPKQKIKKVPNSPPNPPMERHPRAIQLQSLQPNPRFKRNSDGTEPSSSRFPKKSRSEINERHQMHAKLASGRAFQSMPALESERSQALVHSYRRSTLTRSVSDPSIVTTKISTHTLNETPIQHNNDSSPLRRFVTMPPPSTTGRTPLTPNPNTVTIGSLRRTSSPFSATNLCFSR